LPILGVNALSHHNLKLNREVLKQALYLTIKTLLRFIISGLFVIVRLQRAPITQLIFEDLEDLREFTRSLKSV
jgi:hypothetical protein